jgi:hypothetical protein
MTEDAFADALSEVMQIDRPLLDNIQRGRKPDRADLNRRYNDDEI